MISRAATPERLPVVARGGLLVVRVPDGDALGCACPDRKAHWHRFVRPSHPMVLPSETCSTLGCLGPFDHGATIRKVGPGAFEDRETYIVPLCDACHGRLAGQPFAIKATAGLAPAAPEETCRMDAGSAPS